MDDTIYRSDAIALASGGCHPANLAEELAKLPSAHPEPSQIARDIATIIENEQDMRVLVRQERDTQKRVLWTGWKGHRDTRYKCPSCRKPVRNDDVYCHRCGQRLMFPHISFTPYVEGQKQELIVRWDDE